MHDADTRLETAPTIDYSDRLLVVAAFAAASFACSGRPPTATPTPPVKVGHFSAIMWVTFELTFIHLQSVDVFAGSTDAAMMDEVCLKVSWLSHVPRNASHG